MGKQEPTAEHRNYIQYPRTNHNGKEYIHMQYLIAPVTFGVCGHWGPSAWSLPVHHHPQTWKTILLAPSEPGGEHLLQEGHLPYGQGLKRRYQTPKCDRYISYLSFQWLDVIQVNVCISQSVHEVTWLQVRDVCDHVGEQGVAGNVEGHTQAHVSRPLVQLAGQLPIHHVELAEGVAWGEGHERQI